MRYRRLRHALVAALLASIAVTSTASATGASALNVWGTMGVWGTNTNFFASATVSQYHSEGKTVYLVEKFEMSALVQNGKNCLPVICESWQFNANGVFLNAAGQTVGTITPPTGRCNSAAYGANDLAFARCRVAGYEVPLTANRVRFTWTVSVQRATDGLWLNAWGATKTIAFP
jgi:hypothetical protein